MSQKFVVIRFYNVLLIFYKSLFEEKVIYEQENQMDAFKLKIKPILGRSFSEKELEDVLKLSKKYS